MAGSDVIKRHVTILCNIKCWEKEYILHRQNGVNNDFVIRVCHLYIKTHNANRFE